MRWIVVICVAVLLIIAACMEVTARESRKEELKAIREFEVAHLAPCPVCGQTPHLGYCCGEYFIHGNDPKCPCCGIAFSEMHSDPAMEIDAWNRKAISENTTYGAYKNHISHGNCYRLGQAMDKKINQILGGNI